LYDVHKDSILSKQSIDSLRKEQNKANPLNIFWPELKQIATTAIPIQYTWGESTGLIPNP
jgi:hypothetical protein